MNEETSQKIHNCPACGQRVTIYSTEEGTLSYEPWCEFEILRLKREILRLKGNAKK